jgi:hypothetical protein
VRNVRLTTVDTVGHITRMIFNFKVVGVCSHVSFCAFWQCPRRPAS